MSCSCTSCSHACTRYPGWFLPGEAEKAAEYLGISFEEFKKSLIRDHCSNQNVDDAPYVYTPRKIDIDTPEEEIRMAWKQKIPGRCVFLDSENRCTIHAVKPFECREVYVCKNKLASRDDIEREWITAGAPLGMRPSVA